MAQYQSEVVSHFPRRNAPPPERACSSRIRRTPLANEAAIILTLFSLASAPHSFAEELPDWAARAPNGDPVRIAVASPENPRFHHLAWPKAVRTADGTVVLGYLTGKRHPGENCPAVSFSTDGGKTFSPPNILKEFGEGHEYGASGNMALGLAHDGSVLLLAHGYNDDSNHIFGWRSADGARTWTPVDTSALGPNKTGSSTGTIVQIPGGKLMVAGHYRAGAAPHSRGVWCSVSEDDGRSWGDPLKVTAKDGVEPVLVRHRDRLLLIIRNRAAPEQFISVSDDWGVTWKTQTSNITGLQKGKVALAHPFAMVNPHRKDELLAVTFERGQTGAARLWSGNPKTLEFKHERTLLELTKLNSRTNNDYGYAWLLPMDGRRALMFYYHGLSNGPNSIWVLETEL